MPRRSDRCQRLISRLLGQNQADHGYRDNDATRFAGIPFQLSFWQRVIVRRYKFTSACLRAAAVKSKYGKSEFLAAALLFWKYYAAVMRKTAGTAL